MAKPYFLIDFENVQPKALEHLQPGASRIKVFLGQHQTRLMLDLVQALQPFGSDAEYIAIQGSGPDAVDFHIAFYIGRLADEAGAEFNIISKDRGFDPLVRHLNGLGIVCRRLSEIPGAMAAAVVVTTPATGVAKKVTKAVKKAAVKKTLAKNVTVTVMPKSSVATPAAAKGTTTRARVAEVVGLLKKSTKPAKLSSLRSAIKSWFKPALDDKAVDAIVQSLQGSNKITVSGTKVTYLLG